MQDMLWGSDVDTSLESCFVLWDAPATEGLAARGCLKLSPGFGWSCSTSAPQATSLLLN